MAKKKKTPRRVPDGLSAIAYIYLKKINKEYASRKGREAKYGSMSIFIDHLLDKARSEGKKSNPEQRSEEPVLLGEVKVSKKIKGKKGAFAKAGEGAIKGYKVDEELSQMVSDSQSVPEALNTAEEAPSVSAPTAPEILEPASTEAYE